MKWKQHYTTVSAVSVVYVGGSVCVWAVCMCVCRVCVCMIMYWCANAILYVGIVCHTLFSLYNNHATNDLIGITIESHEEAPSPVTLNDCM